MRNGGDSMIKTAFYDTKEYDKPSFEKYGQTHDIKFRLLLPLAVLELSEIEYKGKIYKGVRDSSLINNMQSK